MGKKIKNLFHKNISSPEVNVPEMLVRIIRPVKNQLILLKIEIINYIIHK